MKKIACMYIVLLCAITSSTFLATLSVHAGGVPHLSDDAGVSDEEKALDKHVYRAEGASSVAVTDCKNESVTNEIEIELYQHGKFLILQDKERYIWDFKIRCSAVTADGELIGESIHDRKYVITPSSFIDALKNMLRQNPDVSIKLTIGQHFRNYFSFSSKGGSNVKNLFNLISKYKRNFKSLDLQGFPKNSILFLCRALQGSSIKELSFSSSRIENAMAKKIAQVLPSMSELSSLNLSCNHITSRGSEILARVLPRLAKLTHLNLDSNDIGIEGAMAVATALKDHAQLETLSLDGNNLDVECIPDLEKILITNLS
jgi:hypothetical protein